MEDELLKILEKLKSAKHIAAKSGSMSMTAYLLDMVIVEAEEELDQLILDGVDQQKSGT
ncbi:hypothetical protein [Rhizobium sp. L9]|uniref:hypothetical protein n=1 Tax=Rhizobium sp. L9 TaxID=1340738 RepID=UPI001596AC40|nr:hypothetical protein [Rhizobium sp. L9]